MTVTHELILGGTERYGNDPSLDWDVALGAAAYANVVGNTAKLFDFALNQADGSAKGNNLLEDKMLGFTLILKKAGDNCSDEEGLVNRGIDMAAALELAWRPLRGAALTTVELQIASRSMSAVGAPLGAVADLSKVESAPGTVSAVCIFKVHSGQMSYASI